MKSTKSLVVGFDFRQLISKANKTQVEQDVASHVAFRTIRRVIRRKWLFVDEISRLAANEITQEKDNDREADHRETD